MTGLDGSVGLPTGTDYVVSKKIPRYPISVNAVLISPSFGKHRYEHSSAGCPWCRAYSDRLCSAASLHVPALALQQTCDGGCGSALSDPLPRASDTQLGGVLLLNSLFLPVF